MMRTFLSTLTLHAAEPTPAGQRTLNRYVIEREIPGAASMSPAQLREASQRSNAVLDALGPQIRWVHSHVAGDKIYCVYDAASEGVIREHAEKAGLPANRITPVATTIDPSTGA
jgi:hypothetical protein